MSERRKAEIEARDSTFIPGARGQGRKAPKGPRTTPTGRDLVPADQLAPVVEDRPRWKKHTVNGEPFNEKAAQQSVREFMFKSITEDDLKTIMETAKKAAARGDPIARKWLMDYTAGSPSEKIEVDMGDNLAELMRRAVERDKQ